MLIHTLLASADYIHCRTVSRLWGFPITKWALLFWMQSGSLDYNVNENWLRGSRPASQCVLVWSNDENSTETTNVTIGIMRIKALRRTVLLEWTCTQMWVQIGVHTQINLQTHIGTTYLQRYTHTHEDRNSHMLSHTYTSTIITLHYIHLIKKWNSTVPNVLFLNKMHTGGSKDQC